MDFRKASILQVIPGFDLFLGGYSRHHSHENRTLLLERVDLKKRIFARLLDGLKL